MLRFLTAGESHGPALVGIVEGLPANISLDVARVNHELGRRQTVQGRGGRMSIEKDEVRILSGLRQGRTLGSPLSLVIQNHDYPNWKHVYEGEERATPVTTPRPGHADYPGYIKYGFKDVRDVIERASARETAMRTAIGAIAKQVLELVGVAIYSRVSQLGPLKFAELQQKREYMEQCRDKPLGYPGLAQQRQAEEVLAQCLDTGYSVGGIVDVVAFGLPVGVGSYVHSDRRLDALLAGGLMSIPGVKGVEFGLAFDLARANPGAVGDSLMYSPGNGIQYQGNVNGGLAGGMSTGQPLVARCAVKPIPTKMPGSTVDLITLQQSQPVNERSDTTSVPATAVVAEAVLAWELLRAIIDSFGYEHFSRTAMNDRHQERDQ